MSDILVRHFLEEMEAEAPASRACLERIPENLFNWKPHEKSMLMGYLAVLVADIPNWLTAAAEGSEIDFATWDHFEPKTTADLVARFDQSMAKMRAALGKISDEDLNADFHLKSSGTVLLTSSKLDTISSSIRHSAHHRGQLTVYMRLNDIPVPSIYGPSADDKTF